MRLLVTAAIVIIGLGAFALPRGASLSPRREAVTGEVPLGTNVPLLVPLWIGGAAVLAGIALIVATTRKRA